MRRALLLFAPPLFALPIALAACTGHDLVAPSPMPEQQTDTYLPVTTVRKADILFMIDNSLSMEQEQDNLARNFPAFIDELRKIQGGLPDVHIGVVSSDMGASAGCSAVGQNGLFQGWDRACGLDRESRFIVAANAEHDRNYQGDLASVFGCMARVGTSGCGFEHQLAATTKALSAQRSPENAGFLRDDAYLQIVLITDEDDCSAPPGSTLFSQDFPGEEPSYRCARAGHACGGQMPPDADFSAPLAECKPTEHGALIDVQTFVDQIRALKSDPNKILVSGIFGWPAGAGEYKVGKQIVDERTGRLGGWDYLPACQSMNGNATAALRVKQFVDGFGTNGAFESICSDDFRPVLKRIGVNLGKVIGGPLCIETPPVDTSPAPGVQVDCVVSESVPASGGEESYLPACTEHSTKPCWELVDGTDASTCATGLAVKLQRHGQPVPPESRVAIKCRTCVRPDDPRCQR
jgi:hypothetical protein